MCQSWFSWLFKLLEFINLSPNLGSNWPFLKYFFCFNVLILIFLVLQLHVSHTFWYYIMCPPMALFFSFGSFLILSSFFTYSFLFSLILHSALRPIQWIFVLSFVFCNSKVPIFFYNSHLSIETILSFISSVFPLFYNSFLKNFFQIISTSRSLQSWHLSIVFSPENRSLCHSSLILSSLWFYPGQSECYIESVF